MIARIDRPGRSLALVFDRTPIGYTLPVKQQIIGYLSSRKGGRPFMDFAFSGVGPVRPKDPGSVPDMRTILIHLDVRLYNSEMIDRYDTIISSPPIHPQSIAGEKIDQFTLMAYGEYAILHRKTIGGSKTGKGS